MHQMPPMGGPTLPPAVPRRTSKLVPIVVSAGLGVGVFCGLLFGLGTHKSDAAEAVVALAPTQPAHGTNVKEKEEPPAPVPPQPAVSASAGSTAAAAVKQPEPPKLVKLTVIVHPEAAGAAAKIQIDGREVSGNSVDLPAETKSARVAVTAPGYHSQDKNVDVSGGDTTLEIELLKRAAPATGGGDKPSGRAPGSGGNGNSGNGGAGKSGGGGKKPAGGGLIDI
jgi:hypothetical protein